MNKEMVDKVMAGNPMVEEDPIFSRIKAISKFSTDEQINDVLANIINSQPIKKKMYLSELAKKTGLTRAELKEIMDKLMDLPDDSNLNIDDIDINSIMEQGYTYIHPSIDLSDKLGLVYGFTLPYTDIKENKGGKKEISVVSVPVYLTREGILKNKDLYDKGIIPKSSNVALFKPKISMELLSKFNFFNSLDSVYPQQVYTTYTNKAYVSRLLNSVCMVYVRYIDFPDHELHTLMALWTLGTYVFPLFEAFPYINLYGVKESGKSRTGTVASLLSFNGRQTVGISPSSLFRGIDGLRWSLVLDEAELFSKNANKNSSRREEIMPLVLEGYKRGATVPRINTAEKRMVMEEFETYCPKILASTEELGHILGSRTLPIIMRPNTAGSDVAERSIKDTDPSWQKLRDECYMFGLFHWDQIQEVYESIKNETKFKGRDWELVKPILTLAKYVGNDTYKTMINLINNLLKHRTETKSNLMIYHLLKCVYEREPWKEYITLTDIRRSLEAELGEHKWLNNTWIGNNIVKLSLQFDKKRRSGSYVYMFYKKNCEDLIRRHGIEFMFGEGEENPFYNTFSEYEKDKLTGDKNGNE